MLVDTLLDANRRVPHVVAVEDGVRSLSYRRLTRLATVIRDIIRRNSDCPRIGIMLPASSAFPAVLFGSLWASRMAVPLNFLLGADELGRVVLDAGLDLIVTVRHFESLVAQLPARALFLENLPLKRKMVLAAMRRLPAAPRVEADDTAVILYTSGTMAEPKGVELTYRNLHSNCVDAIASLDIRPPQVLLNTLPPFHVFGLTGNVLMPVVLGATVAAIPRFSPMALVKTVERRRATLVMAIPSMYAAVLKLKSARAESFQSVSLAISGGEPLPDSVCAGFEQRFGVTLREGYGLTETSPVISASSVKAYRAGTVGKPLRSVSVRIVGEDGRDVPAGQDGEIMVRGPGVMKGYYNRPEETRKVIDADGWFHTGDIGRLDADGFLSITGRAKEMLIIGGENVFPREIEAVLEAHPQVLQAAVIGVPDPSRGETAVAFVIPQHGEAVAETELRNFARQSLAGFKVPKKVVVREDLPKGPTGKILKRRLRELL